MVFHLDETHFVSLLIKLVSHHLKWWHDALFNVHEILMKPPLGLALEYRQVRIQDRCVYEHVCVCFFSFVFSRVSKGHSVRTHQNICTSAPRVVIHILPNNLRTKFEDYLALFSTNFKWQPTTSQYPYPVHCIVFFTSIMIRLNVNMYATYAADIKGVAGALSHEVHLLFPPRKP